MSQASRSSMSQNSGTYSYSQIQNRAKSKSSQFGGTQSRVITITGKGKKGESSNSDFESSSESENDSVFEDRAAADPEGHMEENENANDGDGDAADQDGGVPNQPPTSQTQSQGTSSQTSQPPSSKKKKKKGATFWEQYIAELEKNVHNGLNEDKLNELWSYISDRSLVTTKAIKRSLVYYMIPAQPFEERIIDKIVHWIFSTTQNAEMLICKALIDLLYGCVEYDLLKEPYLNHPLTYNKIFGFKRLPKLQCVTFMLLRKITNASDINPSLIVDTNQFLKWDLKRDTWAAVTNFQRLCKALKPELVPNKIIRIPSILLKSKILVNEDFRKRLYNAKIRILGITENGDFSNGPNGMMDNKPTHLFFREFAPNIDDEYFSPNASWDTYSHHEQMKIKLIRKETTVLLCQNEIQLEEFYSWLSLLLKHKFSISSYNPANDQRYEFIFERCLLLLDIIDEKEGISPLNNWLFHILRKWDGKLFKNHIYKLFSYIPIMDFMEQKTYVLDVFEREFLNGNEATRMEIWEMLDKMFLRWADTVNKNRIRNEVSRVAGDDDNDKEENLNLPEILEALFNYMSYIVNKTVQAKGHEQLNLLIKYCQSFDSYYTLFEKKGMPFVPLPPVSLTYMVILSESLAPLEYLCKYALRLKKNDARTTKDAEKYSLLISELSNYFKKKPNVGPMYKLFYREIESGPNEENIEKIENACLRLSFHKNKISEMLKKEDGDLDIEDLRSCAPNVAIFYEKMQN